MSAPHVLIVAPNEDLHARAVASQLSEMDVSHDILDLAHATDLFQLTVDPREDPRVLVHPVSGTTFALNDVRSIWWRRPRRPVQDDELDSETSAFVDGEWRQFLSGLELLAPVLWVNPPEAEQRAGVKAWQLVTAHRCGFTVPRTVLTNHPASVRGLLGDGENLIYKRMGAAARPLTATHAFDKEDLARLEVLPNCPAIFQTNISAVMDIRVTTAGSQVHAVEIHSQEGASPQDWRFDHSVSFQPHDLPAIVVDQLHALMHRLGLRYAAIDLRLTTDGDYVFLEVNPSGQFLFAELLTETKISASVASLLAGT